MYDFIIVGAGFFGSTFARRAHDAGMRVLIIDKRPHIAGAAHDLAQDDYYVSSYGAHIFHTHSEEVWNFASRFTKFLPFINRPKAMSNGNMYSFPINLMTMHQIWGVRTPDEASRRLEMEKVKIENPSNFEEWALSTIGEDLYRRFIYGYTKKQYMREPRDLPMSIIQRLPIRLTYDENYFTTKYQGIPKNGYTNMMREMLNGVDIELGVDFIKNREKLSSMAKHIVYTGPIDEFFDYEHGHLEYNTMRFERKEFIGDQQGNAVVNHVDQNTPCLRSIEHRHFYIHGESTKHYDISNNSFKSVITYDIPISFKDHPDPLYPIRNKVNSDIYQKYSAIRPRNVLFGGRLGEYKYLDMDQSMASAIQKAKSLGC
jgi:UDP-galactopyranose mutase